MKRKFFSALIAASLVAWSACSAPVKLPATMLGVWTEDMTKDTLSGTSKFEKSNGYTAIRFEQPAGGKAVIFVSAFYDPIKREYTWSNPYPLKEIGNNSWSFAYYKREVSIRLDEKNQLQVKGLMMRGYNQDLIKKDPEPVEAIFIKQG
ncbi:MAG TPA: hypothetical protein VE969_03490 [Pyrinomonadaceae bacterium]|jgi:hypothetical protein|nr:hypothetical protein [Pyrinomonadaceae bacterium]